MARLLSNFIDGYTEYLSDKGAPSLFIKWSAIFTVAAAMERKVWVDNRKGRTYPGQFILLTGPAGVGKGLCLNTVYDLLSTLKKDGGEFHIAPSSVTKASLMDALNKAERSARRAIIEPTIISFNSVTAIPNEFGAFMPAWDIEFMNALTDIWDHKRYTESRRTRDREIDVEHAQINLLSGTTPAQLSGFLPEGAWETGFMSRTLVVYSGEIIYIDIFGKDEKKDGLWEKLVHDIRDIYKMFGEMVPTEEFANAVHAWGRGGRRPVPHHPKLRGYCTRREVLLLKLCLVAAAASDSEFVLSIEHFQQALDWLLELEACIPDVFKAIQSGGSMQNMEDTWYMAYEYYMKHKKPIPESLVLKFVQAKEPLHNVQRLVDAMVQTGTLVKQHTDTGIGYIPKGKPE